MNWENNTAYDCDFVNAGVSMSTYYDVNIQECLLACRNNTECTHFVISMKDTENEIGICHLKSGEILKEDASNRNGSVCVIVKDSYGKFN